MAGTGGDRVRPPALTEGTLERMAAEGCWQTRLVLVEWEEDTSSGAPAGREQAEQEGEQRAPIPLSDHFQSGSLRALAVSFWLLPLPVCPLPVIPLLEGR